MEERDPIIDEKNFPSEKRQPKITLIDATPQIAYADGCADGYRKAIVDIMLWSLAIVVMGALVRFINIDAN
jgi:hypothetical protein